MKRLLLVIAIIYSGSAFAQLNIIEPEPVEEIGAVKNMFNTSMETTKHGDTYTIRYQDVKFQQIREFKSFSLNEQAFHELYDFLMDNWDNPPKDDVMIDLDQGYLWLGFTRALGTTNVRFGHAVDENADVIGFSEWLTKRKLDRLFGK